jgi:phenylacetaldehyde dehydrogenase
MNIPLPHPQLSEAVSKFLAGKHQAFIGGKWTDAVSGKTFDTFDPGTGRVIAQVAECDAPDVDKAVAAAREAFEGPWSRATGSERARMMWKLAALIEKHADALTELESLNNGKPRPNVRNGDLVLGCETLHYTAGWATKITGETITLSTAPKTHAFTVREPIGVVGQIIPWNSPIMMATWKLAPALATGCTVVLKPAEQTPLTALYLARLIQEAGIPDGVVNIVPGFGPTAGAAIAAHPDIDKVAFTGSGEVGRLIIQAATGNLKKVSLELGGKSPVIVFPDADLSVAGPGAAKAIFTNSGQVCAAGSRLYAHRRVFDKVIADVAAEAKKIRIGHALSEGTQMGPLVSKEQLERVSGYIDQGENDGATIVTGGDRIGSDGYFIEPTILADIRPEMSVMREEIFGPVLCAMRFDDDDLDRHRQGSQPDDVRPRRQRLDSRSQPRPSDGAQDQGRHGRREYARINRSGPALRRIQTIGLGAGKRTRCHRTLYGSEVSRHGAMTKSIEAHSQQRVALPRDCTFHPTDWDVLSKSWFPVARADEVKVRPTQARLAIPPKLRIITFPTVGRFGLIWATLNGIEERLPDFDAWDDTDFQPIMAPTIDINGSAGRQVEGFLDVAHFAWAHVETFGDRSNPIVPSYKVERTERGVRAENVSSVSNYPRELQHRAPADFPWLRVFEVFPPFAARLIVHFPEGGRLWILNAACPISARKTRLFCPLARYFDKDGSIEAVHEFNFRIFNEDRVIVESQRPEDLPLDIQMEAHIAADRTSIAYRKLLKEMGLGTQYIS